MSNIVNEVGQIMSTRGPALRLVDHKWSALVLGALRLSFAGGTASVPAARLHAQVDAYLEELTEAGMAVPAHATGRGLCLAWVRESWLSRLPGIDGGEVYERTSHALAAERVVSSLSRERAMLNESRLRTIVDAAHRWALEASPDVEARVADLDAEIRALQAERERLAAGGELPTAGADQMRHGYTDVLDLLEQIPGDFRQVEEELEAIHRRMIHDFRTEERPQGEVLGQYLRSARELMTATPAGRAFEGALAILGDEDELNAFRDDLRTIMDHPFAEELDAAQRRWFMDAASILRRGLHDVQSRQHLASRSLAEYLTRAEVGEERELTTALHRVQSELSVWAQAGKVHDAISLDSMPGRLEAGHLRSRTDTLSPPPGAAPLQDVSGQAPSGPDLEEVMRTGGPLLEQVRSALADVVGQEEAELPSAFNALPADLRRPVELFGLMQWATEKGLLSSDAQLRRATVTTVRPDGSTRRLSLPRLPLGAEMLSGESEQEKHGETIEDERAAR